MISHAAACETRHTARPKAPRVRLLNLGQVYKDDFRYLISLLADGERKRAEAFCHDSDRIRFAAARFLARLAVSSDCGTALTDVAIAYHEGGKPFSPTHALEFNLSHAHQWIAVATHDHLPVGVDVEDIAHPHPPEIVNLIMNIDEAASYQDSRLFGCADECFYRLWTRKEAILKAIGAGFRLEPKAVHAGYQDSVIGLAAYGSREALLVQTRIVTSACLSVAFPPPTDHLEIAPLQVELSDLRDHIPASRGAELVHDFTQPR